MSRTRLEPCSSPGRDRLRRRPRLLAPLIATSVLLVLPVGAKARSATPAGIASYHAVPAGGSTTRWVTAFRPAEVVPAGPGNVLGSGGPRSFTPPHLGQPFVSVTATPAGDGAWLVTGSGQVVTVGHATALGQISRSRAPIVAIDALPNGSGYVIAAADGSVWTFGGRAVGASAPVLVGSDKVVAIAMTSDGDGYWLATAAGRVIPYGDAAALGAPDGQPLGAAVVDMVATHTGQGYWVATADGRVFGYGNAAQYGSASAVPPGDRVVGIGGTSDGDGYWLTTAQGRVFAFGDAPRFGDLAGRGPDSVIGIAAMNVSSGYLLATSSTPAQQIPPAAAATLSGVAPTAVPGSAATGGIWTCIRQHESGGNYAENTGNGYYGAYQFSLPTWQAVGGRGLPSQASAAEQDMRAVILQHRAGWSQWSTAAGCGA